MERETDNVCNYTRAPVNNDTSIFRVTEPRSLMSRSPTKEVLVIPVVFLREVWGHYSVNWRPILGYPNRVPHDSTLRSPGSSQGPDTRWMVGQRDVGVKEYTFF